MAPSACVDFGIAGGGEAYNAGFLRTNAVLVLFLLSDSPDLTPPEIPTSDFVQMVHDAKAECGDGGSTTS